MALASFFDKAALSAATFLRGFERTAFEKKLNAVNVGIAFDADAGKDPEQLVGIEMTINLLARLYPTLSLVSSSSVGVLDKMRSLALGINPKIEIRNGCEGITVAVATNDSPSLDIIRCKVPIIFIGASGWVAKVSTFGAIEWGRTQNSFGAAAAACIGAANVFRHIFVDQIEHGMLDSDLSLNLFNYSTIPNSGDQPAPGETDLTGTTLIGAGAIGNAVIWMMQRFPGVMGTLNVIDHESIELSNLQRYVLTDAESIGLSKVSLIETVSSESGFFVKTFSGKWASYLETGGWNFPRLAVAVDSIRERINIVGSLPKDVLNAWTQADEVGISRHFNFGQEACLSCLYFPERQVQSESEIVSLAIGLPKDDMLVRDLLQTDTPVDRAFLERVASGLGIAVNDLIIFQGATLRRFYSEAICGGIVLRLGAKTDAGTEVPMAFQSALAGIFLAAETVIAANQLRREPIPATTRIRVLEAINGSLLTPIAVVDRCICRDPDCRSAYMRKY